LLEDVDHNLLVALAPIQLGEVDHAVTENCVLLHDLAKVLNAFRILRSISIDRCSFVREKDPFVQEAHCGGFSFLFVQSFHEAEVLVAVLICGSNSLCNVVFIPSLSVQEKGFSNLI